MRRDMVYIVWTNIIVNNDYDNKENQASRMSQEMECDNEGRDGK